MMLPRGARGVADPSIMRMQNCSKGVRHLLCVIDGRD